MKKIKSKVGIYTKYNIIYKKLMQIYRLTQNDAS